MREKTCTRCLESLPIEKFSKGMYRCNPCRAEANKFNVQHHRQDKLERESNMRFSLMMMNWKPVTGVSD